jgi:flagellar M-ring protein FliF
MRAIETELARTIGSMRPVESARVHLAVPPQSVFVRQQRQPTASVMLTLFPGRRLEDAQVQSVVHLVASSVPELAPQRVTVVDQNGTLLTRPESDDTAALSGTQFEYRKQLEESYSRRIEDLLSRVVGDGRVRASVAAELDFTVSEQTRESFDPDVAVVRSEQTSEEQRSGESLAQGVPGSLTNQPPELLPAAAAGAGAAPAGGAAEPPTSTSRSQTRNFELDKTISHTRQAVGTIQRLSIGVLVDNRPSAGGRGPGEPIGEQEIASMTELVKQAVGFDEARGDTISVLNSAFQPAPEIGAPEPPALWEQPMVWSAARQVLGAALVLVLAWFIVRPIMATLTRPQPLVTTDPYGGPGGSGSLPGRGMALPIGYDDRVAAARSVAGQDPRQVAQVVRNWVAEDSG